jgi:hypothetical protein
MKDMKSVKALKGGVSELWGVLFGEKGGRLRQNGRGLWLHGLPVLHSGGILREKGGRLWLGRVSTGTTDLPTGATDLPTGSTDLPAGVTDLPAGVTDLPVASTDFPESLSDAGFHEKNPIFAEKAVFPYFLIV